MKTVFPGGCLKTEGGPSKARGRFKRTVALAATVTMLGQNFAWAVCSDGSSLPAAGFVIGSPQVPTAANWSPNVFTAAAQSIFVPDTSVYELNDPGKGTKAKPFNPVTNGGHNWVFDQGSTLCKVTNTGDNVLNGPTTAWAIPPNTPTDCVLLPIIKGGRVANLGDIPYQGQTITPTCNPAILASANNTYFNQLGCSLSVQRHGLTPIQATDAKHATTFMFVAGIKGGLFSIVLDNVTNPVVGGTSGKTVGPANYYSDIPEGSKQTNAAVSPDGMFAFATSIRRQPNVYGCLNPLGDPGDPTKAITAATMSTFANSAQASQSKCTIIGQNGLTVDLATTFGPDNQPYFGGQRVVNTFNSQPGGSTTTAWPQCTVLNQGLGTFGTPGLKTPKQLMDAMKTVFGRHSGNLCGAAFANFGFTTALVTQPQALIPHVSPTGDMYIYSGPLGGTVVQMKLSIDPFSGFTSYAFRTYVTGISLSTGLGVADDLTFPADAVHGNGGSPGSLMVFTDPSAVGLAGQGVVTRLPLCEDM